MTTIITHEVTVGAAGVLLVSTDARYGGVVAGVVGHPDLSTDRCSILRGNLTDAAVSWPPTSASASSRVAPALATASTPPGALAGLVGQNVTLEFKLEYGAVLFAFSI